MSLSLQHVNDSQTCFADNGDKRISSQTYGQNCLYMKWVSCTEMVKTTTWDKKYA